MKHLKNKRGHTIKDAFQEFATWLPILVMAGSSIYLVAALTTEPEPVTVSPTMSPIIHTITQEPEPSPEPEDKPVETPIPTWDVVPSLGDDIDPEPTPFVIRTSLDDIELIARTIWGEAELVHSTMERAAVAWCVLNRVDSDRFPATIREVVTATGQFHGYWDAPARETPEYYIDLAADVVTRWEREQAGEEDVGRVLPAEYLFFDGDMIAHNYFRTELTGGLRWWWTADNPYED